jgi:nitroreductase
MKTILILTFTVVIFIQSMAQDIILPAPDREGGRPLMACLNERKSSREFSSREIPLQEISNLLWAANGINREKDHKHTAPTSMNRQNMEVYVILPGGVYLYIDSANILKLIRSGNYMKSSGKQDFVEKAGMNVIVVSDMKKLGDHPIENNLLDSGIHAGAIIQNIYLYCASVGLNCVVRAWFDQAELSSTLILPDYKRVILAQTIGY